LGHRAKEPPRGGPQLGRRRPPARRQRFPRRPDAFVVVEILL